MAIELLALHLHLTPDGLRLCMQMGQSERTILGRAERAGQLIWVLRPQGTAVIRAQPAIDRSHDLFEFPPCLR